MHIQAFKYCSPIVFYILAYCAFTFTGLITWLPIFFAWVFIPFVELLIQPTHKSLSNAEAEMAKQNKVYDYMLYSLVILQYIALFYFFNQITEAGLKWWEVTGRIFSMGLLCGTFGINVAHELGHRINKGEQMLAKMLLATSLYMHFFIEHNRGHHKHVGTPNDPSSARKNEPIYRFYLRTFVFTYLSAWKISNALCVKKGYSKLSIHNEMLRAQIWQLGLVLLVFIFFGYVTVIYFLLAALIGATLLETVNYIEHYGLQRKLTSSGNFERVMPHHSWNSNHPIGRVMLFELTRHSDHHFQASKKYQTLTHHEEAPQLPTGYPGSMLLALVPPLWFKVMNKRIPMQLQGKTNSYYEIAAAPK